MLHFGTLYFLDYFLNLYILKYYNHLEFIIALASILL